MTDAQRIKLLRAVIGRILAMGIPEPVSVVARQILTDTKRG